MHVNHAADLSQVIGPPRSGHFSGLARCYGVADVWSILFQADPTLPVKTTGNGEPKRAMLFVARFSSRPRRPTLYLLLSPGLASLGFKGWLRWSANPVGKVIAFAGFEPGP